MFEEIQSRGPSFHGFSFPETPFSLPYILLNCGYGMIQDSNYLWDGRARGNQARFVWQYTISGEGALFMDGIEHRLKPGTAFMVRLPSDHRYYRPVHSPQWEFVYATLGGVGVFSLLDEPLKRHGPVLGVDVSSKAVASYLRSFALADDGLLHDSIENSSQAYSLALAILSDMCCIPSQPEYIGRVITMCLERLSDPISVDDMARVSCMTRSHFSREFRRHMNIPPAAFLQRQRLLRARRLLRETNMTIKELSFECGFVNCSYFCRVFRREFGVSPGAFRQSDPIYDETRNF